MDRFFYISANSLEQLIDLVNELGEQEFYSKCLTITKAAKGWYAVFDRAAQLTVAVVPSPEQNEEPYTCTCTCTDNTTCYECLCRQLSTTFMNYPIKLDMDED